MGMGFAPTWLRQVTPPTASQNHFNHRTRLWCYAARQKIKSPQPRVTFPVLTPAPKRHTQRHSEWPAARCVSRLVIQ